VQVKPAANASKAEQRISKMLGNFARTDPSNYPTNIERNVKEVCFKRQFAVHNTVQQNSISGTLFLEE